MEVLQEHKGGSVPTNNSTLKKIKYEIDWRTSLAVRRCRERFLIFEDLSGFEFPIIWAIFSKFKLENQRSAGFFQITALEVGHSLLKFCEFISQKDLRISTHVHTPNSDKLLTIQNFVLSNAAYVIAILLLASNRMGSGQFGRITRSNHHYGHEGNAVVRHRRWYLTPRFQKHFFTRLVYICHLSYIKLQIRVPEEKSAYDWLVATTIEWSYLPLLSQRQKVGDLNTCVYLLLSYSRWASRRYEQISQWNQ